jgi:Na+-driven multidrug efflux pump
MRIISAGYIFYGIGMVLSSAFNGAGDTRTPTWINLFGFWLLQVPLAWLLAHVAGWGAYGVFVAIPVAETAITITYYFIFKKGRWQLVKI